MVAIRSRCACNLKQTRSAQPGVVINDLICGGARGITHASSTIGHTQAVTMASVDGRNILWPQAGQSKNEIAKSHSKYSDLLYRKHLRDIDRINSVNNLG